MQKRLMRKGLPPLFGWLFVTLTVDQDLFDSPQEAFEKGNARLRKAIFCLRACGYSIKRYFWKFETQQNEWPHWHLCVECRDFIANHEIDDAWGYGFTKVMRVSKTRDFKYLFKYVTKDANEIPDWVLDYPKRIRVFQTSSGFYGDTDQRRLSRESATELIDKRITLREKFAHWDTLGTVRARSNSFRGVTVQLIHGYNATFVIRANEGARFFDAYHTPLTIDCLEKYIQPWTPKRRPKNPPPPPRWNSASYLRAPTQSPSA